MRRQPHRETDQRQATAACAAQHATLYPLGFATARQEALEFEIGRRDRFERTDAECLDLQLPAQRADPTAAWEQPVAGLLDVQQYFGRNLAGLAIRCGAAAGGRGSRPSRVLDRGTRAVETAQIERQRDRRLLGRTVGGDNHMTAAGG